MWLSKKIFNENFSLHLLCWVVLVLSIFATFSNFDPFYHLMFSSDSVGLHVIYNDLFLNGGQVKDWIFAAAPTLFPDIFLYLVIRKCIAWDIINISMIYFFFQVLLATASSTYLFSRVAPGQLKKYSWLIPLLFSTLFIETYYFSHDITFAFYISYFSYHGGSFINMIILLCIYFSPMRDFFKMIFLFLFTLVAIFSDMLFLVMVVPFMLTVLINIQFSNLLRSMLVFILVLAGCILGYQLFEYLKTGGYATFLSVRILNPDNAIPSLKVFLNEMYDFIKSPGFRSIHMLFTFLLIPYGFYFYAKNRRSEQKEFAVFFLLYSFFSLCVFSAPIVNGNFSGYDTLRYSISPFYFSLLIISFLIAFQLNKISSRIKLKVVSFAIPTIFLGMILFGFSYKGLKEFLHYKPEYAKEIDEAYSKYGLTRGIAEYWHAKKFTVFSDRGVKIESVYPDLNMHEILSNQSWYFESPYNFVIEDRLSREEIRKEFVIEDTIQIRDLVIYKVKPFKFVRGKYKPVKIEP